MNFMNLKFKFFRIYNLRGGGGFDPNLFYSSSREKLIGPMRIYPVKKNQNDAADSEILLVHTQTDKHPLTLL